MDITRKHVELSKARETPLPKPAAPPATPKPIIPPTPPKNRHGQTRDLACRIFAPIAARLIQQDAPGDPDAIADDCLVWAEAIMRKLYPKAEI